MSAADTTRRTAIVTGAARGIGAAVALRLAADGLDVAVLDLQEEACADTVDQIRQLGVRALAVTVDVADESAIERAVVRVASELNPPAVLINNAGLLRERTLSKTSVDDWNLMLDVNLRGAFLMSRAVAAHLRASGHGRIVNLSSTGALGAHGLAAYSAAKAGLQGLTKSLAIELGRYGTTVNAVAPGFVASAMTAGFAERNGISFAEVQKQMIREIPVGRVGQPEDIAHAVAFFVDLRSSFISGQVLYVAGGPKT